MEDTLIKDYNDKSGLAYYWLEANMGLVLIVLVFACVGLWGLLLEDTAELGIGRRLVRGMGPELAGIVIAAVTVNALAERRQEAERKNILVSQLGSQYRDVTELAVIELKNRGWLYDGSLGGANLWVANLSGASLRGANLSGANLGGANLSGAYLGGADLSGANLWRANLSGANLGKADLSGANLWRADLRGADLVKADLSGAHLEGANLSEASLLGANLWWANLEGANLSKTRLAGANLSRANLEWANLSEAALLGADLTEAELWYANLSGADLNGADLGGANLDSTNLSGAYLGLANLSGAKLWGVKGWTVAQLESARALEGAWMPNEIRLGRDGTSQAEPIEGPTFEQWKEQYLLKHGGSATDLRDTDRAMTEP